jgi:hypothetical protein
MLSVQRRRGAVCDLRTIHASFYGGVRRRLSTMNCRQVQSSDSADT